MTMLIVGLAIFFGVHLVRVVAPDYRTAMMNRMGTWGWKGVYALVALVGFVIMVMGYAEIRFTSPQLWAMDAPMVRMAVSLLMLPALVLLVATYVPGKLRTKVKHPMLIATVVWAASHLLVNGRLADLLLFGSFLLWSLVVLYDASARRPPVAPTVKSPALAWDGVALAVGGFAWWWLAFGGGHLLLFGMPVMR